MDARLSIRAVEAARNVHQLSRAILLWTSVTATVALAALVTSSVVGRALFGIPFPDDVVLSEGLLIATVMLPLAAIQADSGHIRVELLGSSGSKFTRITEAFGNLMGVLLFLALGLAALKDTVELYVNAEFYQGVLRIPIWPTKGLFALGSLFLALELAISTCQPRGSDDRSGFGDLD